MPCNPRFGDSDSFNFKCHGGQLAPSRCNLGRGWVWDVVAQPSHGRLRWHCSHNACLDTPRQGQPMVDPFRITALPSASHRRRRRQIVGRVPSEEDPALVPRVTLRWCSLMFVPGCLTDDKCWMSRKALRRGGVGGGGGGEEGGEKKKKKKKDKRNLP